MIELNIPIEGVVVFDVGGTWFRSGLVTGEGQLIEVSRRPAVNFKNSPSLSVDEMQEALVSYLVSQTRQLQSKANGTAPRKSAVSMGAALNGHTGFVLNSGPLWGACSKPINLLAVLKQREPSVEWTVLNDVTATLLWNVSQFRKTFTKANLFTISTGIACRTYNGRTGEVILDPTFGIQGEIGHLPIVFRMGNQVVERHCDCGGFNHLNAFCSGRGIEALLPIVAEYFREDFAKSLMANQNPRDLDFADLVKAIHQGDDFAVKVLNLVTLPVAEMLLHLFTFDPEIDLVFFTGGVVHSLHPYYKKSLLNHLTHLGLYLVSNLDPTYFQKRVQVGCCDDQAGLRGAALTACQQELRFACSN